MCDEEVTNLFRQLPPPSSLQVAVGSILHFVTGRTISQSAREDVEVAAEMVFDIAAQKTRFDRANCNYYYCGEGGVCYCVFYMYLIANHK